MMIATNWFLWFIAYSFVGWVYETIGFSFNEKRFVNRGFLNGPVCPVYGFGAILSILFFYGRSENILLLFFAGMTLTCIVEYITSVLLEKLFKASWWDYSNWPLNIKGRVSLFSGAAFGILVVLLIRAIHPFVTQLTESANETALLVATSILFASFMADLLITISHLLVLDGRLQEIQTAIDNFTKRKVQPAEETKAPALNEFEKSEFYDDKIKKSIRKSKVINTRIVKAFPKLHRTKYGDAWQSVKSFVLNRKKKK